jgi:ABC-type transport system involved in multi-copper enzyme maturation permease subunit
LETALLHYRPWRQRLHAPLWSVLPVARIALWTMLRRRMFWGLYALSLLIFFMYFFGQYLLAWAQSQAAEESVRVGFFKTDPAWLIQRLREGMKLNGTGEMYRNFFWYQGYMVTIVLGLAGSILVGNDFQMGSLPFYLSKPLGRWHYVAGKCLAVGVFVNLMTTLPALGLYVQYGLLESWYYFLDESRLLVGILGYGLLLTITLTLMLVATATWLRKTVPLLMVWAVLFFFTGRLAHLLVEVFHYSVLWRLMDIWSDTYLVGNACLGMKFETIKGRFPSYWEAGLFLGAITVLCLIYLNRRIRAIEVVR